MNNAVTGSSALLFPLPDLCHGRMVLRVLVLAQAVAILLNQFIRPLDSLAVRVQLLQTAAGAGPAKADNHSRQLFVTAVCDHGFDQQSRLVMVA